MESSFFGKESPQIFETSAKLIGGGATSDSYKVKMWGRWFFMKRPKKKYANDPRYLNAFEREFEIGILLDNDHIVKYHSKFYDDEGIFILTDYVDGRTLTEYIKENGKLPKEEARRILLQIADALKYLHSKQIIHGDLKPDNILITRNGNNVKIVDLGYSYGDCYDVIGGSDGYSAPEQISGKGGDLRADIYAFGKLTKFMTNSFGKMAAKASAVNPDGRYSSMDEVIKELSRKRVNPLWFLLPLLVLAAIIIFSLNRKEEIPPQEETPVVEVPIPEPTQEVVEEPVQEAPQPVKKKATDYSEVFDKEIKSKYSEIFAPFYKKYQRLNPSNYDDASTEWNDYMLRAIAFGDSLVTAYEEAHPEWKNDYATLNSNALHGAMFKFQKASADYSDSIRATWDFLE